MAGLVLLRSLQLPRVVSMLFLQKLCFQVFARVSPLTPPLATPAPHTSYYSCFPTLFSPECLSAHAMYFVSLTEHKLPEGRDHPLFYFLLNPQHPVPRTQPMLMSHLAHETTLFKVLERAQTSTTKTDNRILTWAKDLNRRFFKEDIWDQ